MKLFTAGLVTETSDLTPISTTEREWIVERYQGPNQQRMLFAQMLDYFRELAEAKGWTVTESICAMAMPPGGRSIKPVYENLRDTILEDLKKAMPVDVVLLQLHGAAMAHGYDDCEGDLLAGIRGITGPDIPIGVELDPHCHMTDEMMNHATVMVLYKTFKHTDIKERANDVFRLIADTVEGRVKPTMALFDCRMMDFFDEAFEPMKSFLEHVYKVESTAGILSISPVHGFPLSDVADMGSKMLVITDDNPELAIQVAAILGKKFIQARGQMLAYEGIEAALDYAEEKNLGGKKCIKLLEFGDLAGCGFPTDGTALIQAMLHRGMDNLVAGLMWDPLAVAICHDAGQGAKLSLRIGGKSSPLAGTPLDLVVVVERVIFDIKVATKVGDIDLGNTVVVRSGDTHLILVSRRVGCYGLGIFTVLGVDPKEKDFVVLKHTDGEYDEVITVYGPSFDYRRWPFSRIDKTIWPWLEGSKPITVDE